jgi:hypothetical protein
MTEAPAPISGSAAATEIKRPKNLTFMVAWMVFLGLYQILFAWKYGTFYEGDRGDLRKYYGGGTMEPLYAAIGVAALIIAWGGWRLRPWAYIFAWIFQGVIFAVVLGGLALRIAGKPAPIIWLLLDAAFGIFNVWWLLQADVRAAFCKGKAPVESSTASA